MLVHNLFIADSKDVIIERLQQMSLLISPFICDRGVKMVAGHCAEYRDDVVL